MTNFAKWCIERHAATNHMYDTYLPYEFHLRMVVKAAEDFKHLMPQGNIMRDRADSDTWKEIIIDACWGHDLIEDTRTSYNDVANQSSHEVAVIIYACTNNKGRNRAERANDVYYHHIKATPGATFVKLCDRIANAQYSKMTGSRMFETYKKENPKFINKIGDAYPEMNAYLINLFV